MTQGVHGPYGEGDGLPGEAARPARVDRPAPDPDAPGAGPDRRAAQPACAGARPADPDRPHPSPEGRRRAARTRLPHCRALPQRPVAQERGRLHHAPAGCGDHPRRTGDDRADHLCGPAARHRRGHVLHRGAVDCRLRCRDRGHGGRRHQAGQDPVRRVGEGRDHSQDGAGDEQGHPRPGDQARRPLAQHAHDRIPAPGQADGDRPRHPGDLRPAGPPPRHERDQVGAGGPVLRHPAAEGLRRDREAGRGQGPAARGLPEGGHRAGAQ